jgi:hypothetical protein
MCAMTTRCADPHPDCNTEAHANTGCLIHRVGRIDARCGRHARPPRWWMRSSGRAPEASEASEAPGMRP